MIELVSLGFISLVGLPHGALDGAVIYQQHRLHQRGLVTMLGAYLLIGLGTIGLWYLAAPVALSCFLVMSALHFGLGDLDGILRSPRKITWLEVGDGCALGLLVLLSMSMTDLSRVTHIFSQLIGGDASVEVSMITSTALVLLSIAMIWILYRGSQSLLLRGGVQRVIELLLLFIISLLSTPVVAFAVYFCCFHSVRHIMSVHRELKSTMATSLLVVITAVISVITWLCGAGYLFYFGNHLAVDEAYLRVVFIGLSALTTPHMLLMDAWFWGPAPLSNSQELTKKQSR